MIELTIANKGNKVDGFKAIYKEFTSKSSIKEKTWVFNKVLNELN